MFLPGLAQCAELCWQLRGQAGRRQVPGAKVALQHNIGLGGAVVVTIYKMGFPQESRLIIGSAASSSGSSGLEGFKAYPVFKEIENRLLQSVRPIYRGFSPPRSCPRVESRHR
ncbi:sterol carrier protein 2 [Ameca splendens]|uniref:Sterol carrier protein 2 n=1 Tax=Ameca splendens TaxID=208324 RepID=A0ABV0XF16_9TELE